MQMVIFGLSALSMLQDCRQMLPVLNAFRTQLRPVSSDWTDKILHDMRG
jgi:hypothetical protein